MPKRVGGMAHFPGHIFINKQLYFMFDDMDIRLLGLVFHESWHLIQMRLVGWLPWAFEYLTNGKSRLLWECEAHVFGDLQKYANYPTERMVVYARKGIKSYFPWGLRVPLSASNISIMLSVLWEVMKDISVTLEYRT